MSNYEMIRLGDYCIIERGGSPRPIEDYLTNDENGINWIKIGDADESKYITRTQQKIRPEGAKKSRTVKAGDFILSNSMSFGRPYILKIDGCIHDGWLLIRDENNIFDKDYLYYYLGSPTMYNIFSSLAVGGVVNNLNSKMVRDVYIPLPNIEIQQEIARKLDKVTALISLRKKQLEKLDELVKSRFLELFGDFDLTYQKQDWKPISDIGTVVGGSTPKTNVEEYWNGEYRWISPAELQQDSGVIYESVKKITKAGIESCSLQELPVGTVILSSRAPIGKVAIAGNTFYCNQGFKNIVCKEVIRPRYLYSLLLFNTEYLNSLGRGATFKEISKSIVESIKIPVPKIEKQIEFEDFVEHLDKSKLAVQKSLEQLETLKKSLMQKYFG